MKNCPRHTAFLIDRTIKSVQVQHCPSCSGMWLSAALVEKALGKVFKPSGIAGAGYAHLPACPDDGAPLLAVHHHDVEIDVCTDCGGVWLDKNELERILRARRGDAVADAVADIASDPESAIDITDLAGDAINAVFEFVGEALSGL